MARRDKKESNIDYDKRENRVCNRLGGRRNKAIQLVQNYNSNHRAELQAKLDEFFVEGDGKRFEMIVKAEDNIDSLIHAAGSNSELYVDGNVHIQEIENIDEDTIAIHFFVTIFYYKMCLIKKKDTQFCMQQNRLRWQTRKTLRNI
jgi:hypothetical protein